MMTTPINVMLCRDINTQRGIVALTYVCSYYGEEQNIHPITSSRWIDRCSGTLNCTRDLQLMRLTRCYFSTPLFFKITQHVKELFVSVLQCKYTDFLSNKKEKSEIFSKILIFCDWVFIVDEIDQSFRKSFRNDRSLLIVIYLVAIHCRIKESWIDQSL